MLAGLMQNGIENKLKESSINVNDETVKKLSNDITQKVAEIEGNGKDCFEILLTDDFLLNAGFKELNYGWYAKEYFTDCMESAEVMSIQINLTTGRCGIGDTDFGGCNAMTGRVIKYVHQLQNLVYFLTGSELEVVW